MRRDTPPTGLVPCGFVPNAFVVVRPEPGNAATVARLRTAGLEAIDCPLFAVSPVRWTVPATGHDALLVTSANAVRHAGGALAALAALPVVAVGAASAETARAAGLTVALTGSGDAREAIRLAAAHGYARLLHLAGRDRGDVPAGIATIVTYASEPLPIAADRVAAWRGRTVLLHSSRAARRVADLAGTDRAMIGVIALSAAVLAAAGPGWRSAAAAPHPDDAAMIAIARQVAAD